MRNMIDNDKLYRLEQEYIQATLLAGTLDIGDSDLTEHVLRNSLKTFKQETWEYFLLINKFNIKFIIEKFKDLSITLNLDFLSMITKTDIPLSKSSFKEALGYLSTKVESEISYLKLLREYRLLGYFIESSPELTYDQLLSFYNKRLHIIGSYKDKIVTLHITYNGNDTFEEEISLYVICGNSCFEDH